MREQLFTDNWKFKRQGEPDFVPVLLPHDAMIHEERCANSPGGGAHGYFPGGVYLYEKRFFAPAEWEKKTALLAFEGVYRNSKVSLNGTLLAKKAYGYTPFTVCLDSLLRYGQENVLTVEADNSKLPNSRWYSGSGIYRPVHLFLAEKTHIAYQGVRISTVSYRSARIRAEVAVELGAATGLEAKTEKAGSKEAAAKQPETKGLEVLMEVFPCGICGKTEKAALETEGAALGAGRAAIKAEPAAVAKGVLEGGKFQAELPIPDAVLWSDETPYLYECRVTLLKEGIVLDEEAERFGIREVTWNGKGLFVNGKKTLLRGGCIHHDNGILGAATWRESEERRVRTMKEHGFNALRSSHNPASTALIEACDKYGMYLMDETFDMWYVRKSKYDYGMDFRACWKEDVTAMVDRDYNHPSVIMYSIGNEVSEPGKRDGVAQGKEIIAFIKSLDATRAVTGGMNLMIMGNYSKGKGQYDNVDQEARKAGGEEGSSPKNASLVFNMLASLIGPGMNKAANSDRVDKVTTPILDALDIAGYNYASGRYAMDGRKHPGRIIVGSETFPYEIYKNWEMVKKYPYLIGDFMWTAWDYLGEAGLGAWSYTGGMPFNRPYPWLLGGAGVIDILGNPDASCKYAEVVWGQEKNPVIGVRPVNHPGVRVSKSVWRGTNAIESWSWRGCVGNKATVEVYAKAESVELLLNGKSLGKKKVKEAKAIFKTNYAAGTLAAIAYDAAGKPLGRKELSSAKKEIGIRLMPEETAIKKGSIAYIPVCIADKGGTVESNADERLVAEVQGGVLLAFGSADPCTKERYDTGSFTSYYGRALAVVYAPKEGDIKVRVTGQSIAAAETVIEVRKE